VQLSLKINNKDLPRVHSKVHEENK